MDHFEKTVKAIYKANDTATFGEERSRELPPEWQHFFQKKAKGLIRGQEAKPEVEEEVDSEILTKILTGIIEKIEKLEVRLDATEAIGEIQEEIEEEQEPVRKRIDPEITELRAQMLGLNGELVKKRGLRWQSK